MKIAGIARKDRKTKNLVKRLEPSDIAFIYHEDLDKVSAESLLKTGVKCVVNAYFFCTEKYPNQGPGILLSAGVVLIEEMGEEAVDQIKEGEMVEIEDGKVYQDGKLIGAGYLLTAEELKQRITRAREKIDQEILEFARNTANFVAKERKLLFSDLSIPQLKTRIEGKNCLVVVRGHDYEEDIKALRHFIRNEKPVIIAVDGAADSLIDNGVVPDILIGDMDSVSYEAMLKARDVVVHSYLDGRAPGLARARKVLNENQVKVFRFQGTSEDAALVLAYEKGASLIVLVGSHTNLIDFLDKGRKGMASTFLTRLKVGDRLIDAKGVSRIYRSHAQAIHLIIFTIVIAGALAASVMLSPQLRNLVTLVSFKLQLALHSL